MDDELHRLLLRLGGVLPPQNLRDARFALAAGDTGTLLDSVTRGLARTHAGISPEDLDRLTALAGSADVAEGLRATQQGQAEKLEYIFRPIAAGSVEEGVWVPPVVDMTSRDWMAEALFGDDTDRVPVTFASGLSGVVAIWRSWRETSRASSQEEQVRVFLVEVDEAFTDRAARAAEIMSALADAGESEPLVEVWSEGDPETAYHLDVRAGAALLWAAEAERPVAIAKAFDGVDPDRGPYFSDDHPRLDGDERDRVLRYLEKAPVLLSSTERMVDIFTPEEGLTVSLDHRTDGRWTWTDTVPHYLRRHGLAPDAEFLGVIRANDYTVPEVTAVGRHRALAELFMPVDASAAPA
jgi:hypothetical protein